MNFYVRVINETINYIEENINTELPLSTLSDNFGISDFHFNRMFKTVTGMTMKQYILGRKLTKALELLMETKASIINISMDLGFEYPEVFSRAFKKQYGISPNKYRENPKGLKGIPIASVVERDIINYKGVLVIKGECININEFSLAGIYTETNVYDEDFKDSLRTNTESFIIKSSKMESMNQDKFYTVVSCHGDDSGAYTVFCGRKFISANPSMDIQTFHIPSGWYVNFEYRGDMFEIRESLIEDLYRWIMVKEAKLNYNHIGMINIYHNNYPEDNRVNILFPIDQPV
jgi:AraC family transcriptional regulator